MCALCGVLLNEHWAEQEGGRRERVFRVRAPEPRARLLRADAATTGAAASGSSAIAKGRSTVIADLGSLWVEAEKLAGPDARPARPRPGRVRCEDPGRARHGVSRQRQDHAALPPPRAPGHGRDGGDRERARRGRDRPPPAAAGRRAHGAAAERLPLLRAPRRSRRRAARPDRPSRRRRDPALPARRRRDDRARRTRRRSCTRSSRSRSSSTTTRSTAWWRPSMRSTASATTSRCSRQRRRTRS